MAESSDGHEPAQSSADGGDGQDRGSPQQRPFNRNKKKKDQKFQVKDSKFEGDCAELKDALYTIGGKDFPLVSEKIARYFVTHNDYACEFQAAIAEGVLPDIVEPDRPQDANDFFAVEEWKDARREWRKEVQHRKQNVAKGFELMLGQCEIPLRDRMRADANWADIKGSFDIIRLRELIRRYMSNRESGRHNTHSRIDADVRFCRYRQDSRSDATYHREFKSLMEECMSEGSMIGLSRSKIQEHIQGHAVDPQNPTDEERTTAEDAVREEYAAISFIMRSDIKRYETLQIDVQNNYTMGIVGAYPTTLTDAYNRLLVWKTSKSNARNNGRETSEIAFLQDGDQDGQRNSQGGSGRGGNRDRKQNGGRGNSQGRGGGGGRGHNNAGRGHGNNNSNNGEESQFLTQSSEERNGNNNSSIAPYSPPNVNSSASSFEPAAHLDTCHVEIAFQQSSAPIPKDWLLLDTCSTVNMISNQQLLHDITTVDKTLSVRCTAGVTTTNQMGKLGNFPEPVWYHPNGIANILSFHSIREYYNIKYDNKHSDCFEVGEDQNSIQFVPSSKGLYYTQVRDVENGWSMLQTVDEKKSKYTKRALQQADLARRIQNIIMRPGSRKLQDIVRKNLIPNCPIVAADVAAADDIYGPNSGSLRGKTVHRPNSHVQTGVDGVPPEIMSVHQDVTLAADIMFINAIPFFVTVSRNIKFGTVHNLPDRQVPTLIKAIREVINVYKARGFRVTSILTDPEFLPLKDSFPGTLIDPCGENEHVPDVERYIRTIKDSVRSCNNSLPFARIPRIMLIHMVKNAVFWLNSIPAEDGVSEILSPRYILTGRSIDYNRHVQLEFGAYVHTHDKHSNDMNARTTSAICLGPTGNAQGTHYFLSLRTGRILRKHRWTHAPTPTDAIDRVNALGAQQGMPKTVTFGDRYGRELPDGPLEMDDEHDSLYDPNDDNSRMVRLQE